MQVIFRALLLATAGTLSACSGCSTTSEPAVGEASITVRPIRLLADGRATAEVIVTVRDTSGAAVAGELINLTASGDSNQLSCGTGTTDETGVFVATIASTAGGTKTVTAEVGSLDVSREVHFTSAPACTGVVVLGTVPAVALAHATLAGDLDGDGVLDLVGLAGGLQVMHGNGNGTFRKGSLTALASVAPHALAVADLNADGRLDVIVARADGLVVFLGNADASFAAPIAHAQTLELTNIAIADFDNDDKRDVAVSGFVLFGRGDGTFETPVFSGLGQQFGTNLAAGDFNGDGRDDLTVATSAGIRVALSNSDRTFQPPTDVSTPLPVSYVGTGDFNTDGKLDVVTLELDTSYVTTVRALLGGGDGTFQTSTPATLADRDSRRDLSVLDADRDGRLDVIGAGHLVRGNGDGTFGTRSRLVAYEGLATAGDVDRDGDDDLVFALNGAILLAEQPGVFASGPRGIGFARYADFDNDGFVDLLTVEEAAGPMQRPPSRIHRGRGDGTFDEPIAAPASFGAVADLNRDGLLDLATWERGIVIVLGRGNLEFDVAATDVRTFPDLAADFDGDHRPDLAGIDMPGESFSMLPGNGDGTFGPPRVTPKPIFNATAADFDRDGVLDLATTAPQPRVYYGAGDGTFARTIELDGSLPLGDHAVADLNEDGHLDLIAGYATGLYPPAVRLFPGNALGRFGAAEDIAMPMTGDVSVVDINSDGRLDIVLTDDTTTSIRLRNSQGSFDPPLVYPVTGQLVDLDQDGRLDIVAGTSSVLQRCLP